jgi:hypothetical protein
VKYWSIANNRHLRVSLGVLGISFYFPALSERIDWKPLYDSGYIWTFFELSRNRICGNTDQMRVVPPSFRVSVSIEIDYLIRVYVYTSKPPLVRGVGRTIDWMNVALHAEFQTLSSSATDIHLGFDVRCC